MRFTTEDIATMRLFVPIVFLIACVYYAFKILGKMRFIRDTPTSKIRSAAQGYLELQGAGELMPGPPIMAPGSGLKCLWYEYTVEALEQGQDYSRWVTTLHQISDDCFYIRDETGVCVVDPHKAQIIPSRKSQWYGTNTKGYFSKGRIRHTETVIDIAAPLLVIGEFKTIREADHELTASDNVGDLIRSWKKNYNKLLNQFDSNKDGELDRREWDVVLMAAEREVRQQQEERTHQTGVHVIAHPEKRGRPFVIAGKSQQSILWTYWFRLSGITLVGLGALMVFFKLGLKAL